MGFMSAIFGRKKRNPVPRLLRTLQFNAKEEAGLKAVFELGQLGTPQTRGPLLFAAKNKNEKVRQAALDQLEKGGIDRIRAGRVDVLYQQGRIWQSGLKKWLERSRLMDSVANIAPAAIGVRRDVIYGGHDTEAGFFFDDETKAVSAALDSGRGASVWVWAGKSMVSFGFGVIEDEVAECAAKMKSLGASAFMAINVRASLESRLSSVFPTKDQPAVDRIRAKHPFPYMPERSR